MQRIFGSVALLVAVIGPASLTAQQLSLVIDATSPASPYSTDVGGRRVFICRPNLPIQPIWGTDVHTDDPSIAASATPRFKTRGEVTGAIYSCLAIVTDPKNLPDPAKGECITTEFTWP